MVESSVSHNPYRRGQAGGNFIIYPWRYKQKRLRFSVDLTYLEFTYGNAFGFIKYNVNSPSSGVLCQKTEFKIISSI